MQTQEGRDLVKDLLRVSRESGSDLWDVMEDKGKLLTSQKARQIKSEAISELLYLLDREQAETLLQGYLGGKPATAAQMFEAVRSWIHDYQQALEAGHVG